MAEQQVQEEEDFSRGQDQTSRLLLIKVCESAPVSTLKQGRLSVPRYNCHPDLKTQSVATGCRPILVLPTEPTSPG